MLILLLEDDDILGEGLHTALTYAGYNVYWCKTVTNALKASMEQSFELAVLDVNLPDGNGFDFLKQLKARTPNISALFLTAQDAVPDKIHGLNIGADDYIVKPCHTQELIARIRVCERRLQVPAITANTMQYQDITVDMDAFDVKKGNDSVSLSITEYRILITLLKGAGRVFSRDQLLDALYGWGESVESNAIEVHIHHIRKKLTPSLIKTIRSAGYMVPKL